MMVSDINININLFLPFIILMMRGIGWVKFFLSVSET